MQAPKYTYVKDRHVCTSLGVCCANWYPQENQEGDKLNPWWIGLYSLHRSKGKGVYILSNTKTAQQATESVKF